MWIETENTKADGTAVTQRISLPDLDEPVEFNENGKAQVTADVGELLIREVDSIVESGSGDSDEDSEDDVLYTDEIDQEED